MGALARLDTWLAKAFPAFMGGASQVVGWSGGSYAGPLPGSYDMQWWQLGLHAPASNSVGNAGVEACVSAISQTISMLPLEHWQATPKGGRKKITTSAAHRTVCIPNNYQTRSEFFLGLIRAELLEGNGYAYAIRNGRNEVSELHLLHPYLTRPMIVEPWAMDGTSPGDQAEIFYETDRNPLAGIWPSPDGGTMRILLPQRDVLHVRMHTARHPLVGITPIAAAIPAVTVGNSISMHSANFFQRFARPSGYLKVPGALASDAMKRMREEWQAAHSGENVGRTAVLGSGATWEQLTMTAVDAQVIDTYKMTIQDIARVFRVPLPVVGMMEGSTYNDVETLLRHWIATGLGFMIENLEQSLDRLYGLDGVNEWMQFDTEYSLLRSDFAARIAGLVKGVQGGIFSPNEARLREGYEAVPHGDSPRVQQQVVPLDWHETHDPPMPGGGTPPADEDEDENEPPEDDEEEDDTPPPPPEKSYWDVREALRRSRR